MISEFSDRTDQLLSTHEVTFPQDAGFSAAIAEARKVVESVPAAFSFAFFLNPTPAAMGSDPAVVFPRLLAETEGWLGFIVHSTAFRLAQLLDDVVTGLNQGRPYRVAGAARCLLELAAFVHQSRKLVMEAASAVLPKPPADFSAAVAGVASTLKVASRFAQVTRFNWAAMVRGDAEEFYTAWDKVEERLKATQILTLIDKLPGESKRAARFFYEMLCDFVHQNVGSHILLVSSAEAVSEGRMRWTVSREPTSDEALLLLLHVIAIPVRDSIWRLIHDMQGLQQVYGYFCEWRQHCEAALRGKP